MPLNTADSSIDSVSLLTVPEQYIIFYSSIVDGRMWCPDCRAVEEVVNKTFSQEGPSGLIVYVGAKEQWKNPSNIYRQEPWNITSIPTIVKIKEGKEVGRIVDDTEVLEKLATFAT